MLQEEDKEKTYREDDFSEEAILSRAPKSLKAELDPEPDFFDKLLYVIDDERAWRRINLKITVIIFSIFSVRSIWFWDTSHIYILLFYCPTMLGLFIYLFRIFESKFSRMEGTRRGIGNLSFERSFSRANDAGINGGYLDWYDVTSNNIRLWIQFWKGFLGVSILAYGFTLGCALLAGETTTDFMAQSINLIGAEMHLQSVSDFSGTVSDWFNN